jgi:hypothetical protein
MATVNYYKQLHRHDPSEGLIGDCWRTCIANLLGLKPQQVPHFVGDSFDLEASAPGLYKRKAKEWLALRNLTIVEFCFAASDSYSKERLKDAPPYILTGQSNNFKDICHSVLGHKDFQVLFDPAQNSEGLELGPWKDDSESPGVYWCEFLVPINLAEFLKNSNPATLL